QERAADRGVEPDALDRAALQALVLLDRHPLRVDARLGPDPAAVGAPTPRAVVAEELRVGLGDGRAVLRARAPRREGARGPVRPQDDDVALAEREGLVEGLREGPAGLRLDAQAGDDLLDVVFLPPLERRRRARREEAPVGAGLHVPALRRRLEDVAV